MYDECTFALRAVSSPDSMCTVQIAHTINDSLAEHFPEESGVRVIAEPGRFFVASAFTLYTTVIAKREAGGRPMYYLNDGVYGSFNCTVFDHAEPVPFALRGGGPLVACSLWGPTCDSMDLVLEDALLPELQPGDWVVFENMGAYTLCAASTFNGFQAPEVKYMLTYATRWVLPLPGVFLLAHPAWSFRIIPEK